MFKRISRGIYTRSSNKKLIRHLRKVLLFKQKAIILNREMSLY
jgi:hypothetical protein